ncbi:hypothetical protein HS125_07560 [bacterium]|nr:hypothetical protein [bacterium]
MKRGIALAIVVVLGLASTAACGAESPAPREAPKSSTVYITKSGKKYHRDGCRSLAKSKIAISREEAKKQGYTPCSVCKPDGAVKP